MWSCDEFVKLQIKLIKREYQLPIAAFITVSSGILEPFSVSFFVPIYLLLFVKTVKKLFCRLELSSVCCCDFDRGRSRRTEDKKGQAVSRRFEEVPCVAIRLRWALRTQWVEPARPSRLSWSAMARASGTNSTSFVDGKNMEMTVSRVLQTSTVVRTIFFQHVIFTFQ